MHYSVPMFSICPRCEDAGFERLANHSHCALCSYSSTFVPENEGEIPDWVLRQISLDMRALDQALRSGIL